MINKEQLKVVVKAAFTKFPGAYATYVSLAILAAIIYFR